MSNNEKKEIINMVKRTQHYCNLLVGQCNNWQPSGNGKKYDVKQQSIAMQVKALLTKTQSSIINKKTK